MAVSMVRREVSSDNHMRDNGLNCAGTVSASDSSLTLVRPRERKVENFARKGLKAFFLGDLGHLVGCQNPFNP